MIRLIKEAPWNEVTLNNVKINKLDFIDEVDLDLRPFIKWLEFKSDIAQPDVVQNSTIDVQVDYSQYSKADLISIATGKGLDTKGLTKSKIIEKLCIL